MERDWIKIYTSSSLHKASIVEAVLKDHEIDVVQLNKQERREKHCAQNCEKSNFIFIIKVLIIF
mgnify:CR=1 FL=1